MVAFKAFPDIEAIVCQALQDAGITAGSKIPPDPMYPLCVVQRLGGISNEKRKLDCARIQIDTWAENKEDAFDTAESARVALYSTEGQIYDDFNAMVSAVETETTLIWAPDPELGTPRYHFTVEVYAFSTS